MILAIVQARMGSTRLPGKVLQDLNGDTVLGLMIKRLRLSKRIDRIVIATTLSDEDIKIAEFSEKMGVDVFRGSEDDVLDRFYQAAKERSGDIVIRLTSDCPFIDPNICDRVIDHYLRHQEEYDYVSNTIELTYPDGLGVEVIPFNILQKCWEEAHLPFEREHVTQHIRRNQGEFSIGSVVYRSDYSKLRWTVDCPEDLTFVRQVYTKIRPLKGYGFDMEDVIDLLEENPELSMINAHLQRDEGLAKSMRTYYGKQERPGIP